MKRIDEFCAKKYKFGSEEIVEEGEDDDGEVFAQSPYLLNSFISYANPKIGTEVNLNLNVLVS